MNTYKNYLFAVLLILPLLSFAQYTEVINSNRPGVSRSAFSVGTGVIQLEVGPYLINEERTPEVSYEVKGFGADFAARYGLLLPELEINVEGTYQNDTQTYNSAFDTDYKRSNFKNLTIGAKYLVYDPYKNAGEEKPNLFSYHANRKFRWKSLIPAVAVYAGANFDTKNNPYTAPDVEGFSPKVMVVSQNNFSSGWVLVINLIKDRIGSEFSDFQYIITLTKALNPKVVLFGETQGIKSDFYADNLFRFGGAYLLSKDFQLDTAVTFNTKDTPSVFSVNLGASYRFDFHKDKQDNGTSAEDEAERRANKKNKKNKNKDDDSDGGSKKRKKQTKEIDFDEE